MIYNPKMKDNRRFKAVELSSARKLFERYGYSLADDGHPDGTNPFEFKEPSFKNGVFSKDVVSNAFVKGISKAFVEEPKEVPKVEPNETPKDESND